MSTNPVPERNSEAEATTNGAGAAASAAAATTNGAARPDIATGGAPSTSEAAAGAEGDAQGSGDAGDASGPFAAQAPGALDARPITTAKDISLKDFLNKMDDYAPIIPDAVTNYYMTKAGLPPPPQTDQRLARLLALATQKFVADIAADAYQYSRVRASNSNSGGGNPMGAAAGFPLPGQPGAAGGGGGGGGGKEQGRNGALGVQRPGFGGGGQGGGQNRTVLTMEDLGMAVGEYGVNVKRGEFYR
ncbi:hypothetical protein SCUCBS95973_006002 [Sporothrix curviconia]|uniref:Transcription initiation factor TFIID subunit 10 n=1 Tax=Sporothrix curviconia TaxID=1260050 RepID=A0ABP0C1H4_9PEZI